MKFKHEVYNLEQKPGTGTYHARAHPIPKINEQTLRNEVDRLGHISVLRKQGEPLRMGSTHFYYSKERWKCTFYLGLSRAKQTVKEEAIPYTKDTRSITKARRLSVCYITGSQHGLLSHRALPVQQGIMYDCTPLG